MRSFLITVPFSWISNFIQLVYIITAQRKNKLKFHKWELKSGDQIDSSPFNTYLKIIAISVLNMT